MNSSPQVHTLDVRPLIAGGEEPFATIRAKIESLGPRDSLELIAPFLPSPLIEMLKSEGFSAHLEHRGDGAWSVLFRHS